MSQLHSDGIYPCPLCRIGDIRAMLLMDTFACDCCNQIFEVNLEKEQLKLLSRQPALLWRWNGKKWVGAHVEGMELGWGYLVAALALVALPTTLIGLTIYTFPPTPETPLFWFPYVWAGLTFLSHLTIVGWLVIEFYQLPVGVYFRLLWQRLLNR